MGSPTVFMPTQDMSYFCDVQTKKKRYLLQMKRLTDATILYKWHTEKVHLAKSQLASDPLRVEQAREDTRGIDARTSLWSGWRTRSQGSKTHSPTRLTASLKSQGQTWDSWQQLFSISFLSCLVTLGTDYDVFPHTEKKFPTILTSAERNPMPHFSFLRARKYIFCFMANI